MEKLLKKERIELKNLMSSLYPDKYVRVRKNGTVIIKNKFYSLTSIKLSYEEVVNDLIIRCFSVLHEDTKAAFERYYNTINYSTNKGYGAIRYLCDEYSNLNPKKEKFTEILNIKYKKITMTDKAIVLSYLSKQFSNFKIRRQKVKALPMGEKSQLLIPFEDLLGETPRGKIVAVVTTGNPDWDKELEKVIRFDNFF